MVEEDKCWLCGNDADSGGGFLWVENFISKVAGYHNHKVCPQCAHIAETYYQEWRRDLRQALKNRVIEHNWGHLSWYRKLKERFVL